MKEEGNVEQDSWTVGGEQATVGRKKDKCDGDSGRRWDPARVDD